MLGVILCWQEFSPSILKSLFFLILPSIITVKLLLSVCYSIIDDLSPPAFKTQFLMFCRFTMKYLDCFVSALVLPNLQDALTCRFLSFISYAEFLAITSSDFAFPLLSSVTKNIC